VWDDPRVPRSALPALLTLAACAAFDCGGDRRPVGVDPEPPPANEPAPPPAPPAEAATLALQVPEPSHPVPAGAPHALVQIPEGFRADEPWDLVVFLHGWSGCVNVLMHAGPTGCVEGIGPQQTGWDLAGAFADANANALFLMPQLAFRRRDGSAGRFAEEGFVKAFVDAVAQRVDPWPAHPPQRVVVMAHSAGFESALAWIRQSAIPVDEVVLFDALYAGTEAFARWVGTEGRRLVSIHTGHGSTARQSRRLDRLVRRASLSVGDRLTSESPVVILETGVPHRDVPRAFLAAALRREGADTSDTEIQ